jgi:rod shape-determining protein MreB
MLKIFDQVVYVQLKKNAFNVYHVQKDKSLEVQASTPFSTDRLAIGNFAPALETLKKALVQISPKSLFRVSPKLIMHQLYPVDDELSQVEERVLRELAVFAGSRQIYIWSGNPLSKEQLLGKVYEKPKAK